MSNKLELTPDVLKGLIEEEKKKLKDAGLISSDAVKDVWAGGKNLVNKIDYVKKLSIKENSLKRRLKRISNAKKILKAQIMKEI